MARLLFTTPAVERESMQAEAAKEVVQDYIERWKYKRTVTYTVTQLAGIK